MAQLGDRADGLQGLDCVMQEPQGSNPAPLLTSFFLSTVRSLCYEYQPSAVPAQRREHVYHFHFHNQRAELKCSAISFTYPRRLLSHDLGEAGRTNGNRHNAWACPKSTGYCSQLTIPQAQRRMKTICC